MNGSDWPSGLTWQRGAPGELHEGNRPLVKKVAKAVKAGDREALVERLTGWHPADVVELLVHLPLKRARKLHGWLPPGPAANVVAAIDPRLRAVLMEEATLARQAEIIGRLQIADAVNLLSQLPAASVEALLPRLNDGDELRQRLGHDRESAGAIMDRRFVAVPPDWTVAQAVEEIRLKASDIERLYAVYIIGGDQELLGMLKLYDLLLQASEMRVGDVMRTDVVVISASMDREEVMLLAERYDLVTLPVVDEGHRLIGRITVDELRDVMRLEAQEDAMLMAGVDPDARPDDTVLRMVRGRFVWLVVGMIGSVLGALIILHFEQALEEAAILAAFIPLVAATAGNAGIQSASVAVQGLAYGSVWNAGLGLRFAKEAATALLNGLGAALLVGLFVFAVATLAPESLERPTALALTIGAALTLVVMLATLMGAAMPLLLDRVGIDPAVSTGPFITVTNDVVGILVYFVSATLIYFH